MRFMRAKIILIIISACIFSSSINAAQTDNTGKLVINFGVLNFYPPFVYTTGNGMHYGFSIAVAQGICQRINAVCKFHSRPLHELFDSLLDNSNPIDALISAISITQYRQQFLDFSLPYFHTSASLIKQTSKKITQFRGLKVGATINSTFYDYLTQNFSDVITVVPFVRNVDELSALSNGEIDLMLIDTPVADYWVENSSGLLEIFGAPIDNHLYFGSGYGIAVMKGNQALLDQLNNGLRAMVQDGSLDDLINEYFSKNEIMKN